MTTQPDTEIAALKADNELLRAQLIVCTRAMRHTSNELRNIATCIKCADDFDIKYTQRAIRLCATALEEARAEPVLP